MMGKSKSEKISYKDVSEKVRGGLGLTRQELGIRHGQYFEGMNSWCFMNLGDLQNVVMNVEKRLEPGWLEKWKAGDDSVWAGALAETGNFEYVQWPGRMKTFGASPIDVVKVIIPVVAERAMNRDGLQQEEMKQKSKIELVSGEVVENNGRYAADSPEELEVIDAEVSELSGSETGELRLGDGEAIVQFEGVDIEQQSHGNRMTCILAVMQVLMSHAGYIESGNRVNFVEAKGDILRIADRLGALHNSLDGTLSLFDVDGAVRPVLEETKLQLMRGGYSVEKDSLGEVTVTRLSEMGDIDGGGRDGHQGVVLDYMEREFLEGKNVIYGYTASDKNLVISDGHERVINGVGRFQGKTYFHIIDPISGGIWLERTDMLGSVGGPIFRSESKSKPSGKSILNKDEIIRESGEPDVGHKGIRWG